MTEIVDLLNEMRAEFRTRLEGVRADIARTDAKVDGVIAAQAATDAKVDRLDAKVGGLDAKVDGLASKVDRMDVKLDRVIARADDVMAGQVKLMTRMENQRDESDGFAKFKASLDTVIALLRERT